MDDYPRTYRYALWVLVLGALMGVFFVGGAFALAGLVVFHSRAPLAAGQLPFVALALLVPVLLGGWFIVSVFRAKVVLTADEIAVYDAFRVRRMARADIAGRRLLTLQYGQSMLVLAPKDARLRELKVSSYTRTDGVWEAWIAALPDLDAQAVRDLEAEVAANAELGQTPDERLARLAAARRLATGANVLTYTLAAWGYFYPRPYGLAVASLAALPWLAVVVVARSHGLLRIDSQRGDPRPTLGLAVVLPGFALLLRALGDVGLLELPYALGYATLTAATLTWAGVMSDAAMRARPWTALIMCAVLCSYGYGVVALGNAWLDRGAGTDYRVAVLDRHINHGRHTSYNLLLDRWGPRASPERVNVSGELYMQSPPGSSVCVHYGPGALAIPWFVVRSCGASHG